MFGYYNSHLGDCSIAMRTMSMRWYTCRRQPCSSALGLRGDVTYIRRWGEGNSFVLWNSGEHLALVWALSSVCRQMKNQQIKDRNISQLWKGLFAMWILIKSETDLNFSFTYIIVSKPQMWFIIKNHVKCLNQDFTTSSEDKTPWSVQVIHSCQSFRCTATTQPLVLHEGCMCIIVVTVDVVVFYRRDRTDTHVDLCRFL